VHYCSLSMFVCSSSDDSTSTIKYMESQLAKLDAIWRKIGVDCNQMVRKRVESFMDDMIAEAASRKQALVDSIESLQASIGKLVEELELSRSAADEVCYCKQIVLKIKY